MTAKVERRRSSRPLGGEDPLAPLDVIDTLTVGPTRVEPARLTTPYSVTRGRASETTELVYRWEEPVFDPGDPRSQRLAAMIGAQVSLNYGLFCRRMVYRDPLDTLDRRFVEDYSAHTAREIYVNKLLTENPFLVREVADLPLVRRADYRRAELVFERAESHAEGRSKLTVPHADASSYAVLSSGGKDSLLSYGIVRELGAEVHPVFINESGRHWFTALNAYRSFKESVPNTTRVWTNSDRVFAWMLRHMPLIRRDFSRVRSDEYPIRLWTVAVFLFGALPLLLKRGVGRLLIGNEFDTSARLNFSGITHYNGLYDQSRWFDNAMSRYFGRKGWGVAQFSLLRPMSELLIEKMLVERYPELQLLQVSCHATHTEGDRVRPCGRCEKCRRIVGMLLALDADPRRCGYDDSQIESCIEALAREGVHQEQAGSDHLFHLLEKRGHAGIVGRARPEVMSLRFDTDRSPFETVPRDLRRRLFELQLAHAEGAVCRRGREWRPCDPLADEALARPSPVEPVPAPRRKPDGPREDRFRLGEFTWPEARERLRVVDVALLPVGAVEQHGPHLPLDTDAYDAARLAEEVAVACSHPRPIVLPLIAYGVSYHHDDFPGTLSIGPDTLSRMVYEIGMSAARNGITKLVIINGHGGNAPALHFAAQMINRDAHIFTCVDTGETSDADIDAMAETRNDVHAGEIETSTALALRPELVRMEEAESCVPNFDSRYLDFSSRRGVVWYAYTKRISPSGVMGDPTRASSEKGRRMWEVMVRNLVELVEDLKQLSLDEIHQRRY